MAGGYPSIWSASMGVVRPRFAFTPTTARRPLSKAGQVLAWLRRHGELTSATSAVWDPNPKAGWNLWSKPRPRLLVLLLSPASLGRASGGFDTLFEG